MNVNRRILDVFKTCFSVPPQQGPVGRAPGIYLELLDRHSTVPRPAHQGSLDFSRAWARDEVRALCQNPGCDPLTAYAAAMAWGGQRSRWFLTSTGSLQLVPLLNSLRESSQLRGLDFADAMTEARAIPGLGVSFLTKLLYFFRQQPNAYILDQWTARAMDALCPGIVRLHGSLPAPDTTAEEYTLFCEACEGLTRKLRGWTPDQVEQALFDRRGGKWREWLKSSGDIEGEDEYPETSAPGGTDDGGAEPPDEIDGGSGDGEEPDPYLKLLQAIGSALNDARSAGMPFPPGIVRTGKKEVWIGGKGFRASEIVWEISLQASTVRVGARFAPKAFPIFKRLVQIDSEAPWFGGAHSVQSGRSRRLIVAELPLGSGKEFLPKAEAWVSLLSSIYVIVRGIARTNGIQHPQL